MDDRKLLEMYIPLVNFLSDVLGSGCEVILHDVSNPTHSVIAISGTVTERAVGDPMTDLACEIMEREVGSDEHYLSNYQGQFKSKQLLSSTYYIKNCEKLIGMLCINRDISAAKNLEASIQSFMEQYNFLSEPNETITEHFDRPVSDMMNDLIEKVISEIGASPERMTIDEKIEVVRKLNEQGVLTMKGSVGEIAKQLMISEPTVYRYLRRVNQDE